MTKIMRIDEMRISSRGIKFPIDTVNKMGEKIHIEKNVREGKYVYSLIVDNGQFNYATSDFEDCLNFARLTIDDVN